MKETGNEKDLRNGLRVDLGELHSINPISHNKKKTRLFQNIKLEMAQKQSLPNGILILQQF